MKIEELRLQELKLNRELVKDKEEIKYLNNIICEYEHTISSLEEEIVQQNKVSFYIYFDVLLQYFKQKHCMNDYFSYLNLASIVLV